MSKDDDCLVEAGTRCKWHYKCGRLKELARDGDGCPFEVADAPIRKPYYCQMHGAYELVDRTCHKKEWCA